MAAGQGFKTFATGDVLSASDVNGYLMQGVLVFADATERNAEITSPQEGQFAYLKDTNVTTYYTGSAWANLDTTGMTNPMTTTGDTIYSSSGSTPARLGIGSTGQVLTVSGGVPSWATPAASTPTFVGCSLWSSGSVSAPNNTVTTMTFDSELFDTDGFHSTSTNTGRITIPAGKAGYYLLFGQITFLASSGGARTTALYKNGSASELIIDSLPNSASVVNDNPQVTSIQYLAVGDYIEMKGQQASGGALNMRGGVYYSTLLAQYLGA